MPWFLQVMEPTSDAEYEVCDPDGTRYKFNASLFSKVKEKSCFPDNDLARCHAHMAVDDVIQALLLSQLSNQLLQRIHDVCQTEHFLLLCTWSHTKPFHWIQSDRRKKSMLFMLHLWCLSGVTSLFMAALCCLLTVCGLS